MLTELQVLPNATGRTLVFFPITFETSSHSIKYSTFQRCGAGVLDAYRSAEIALFGSTSELELELGAFEESSFRAWFGAVSVVMSGWAAQEFAGGFIQGLTGKTLDEYGQMAAAFVKDGTKETVDTIANLMAAAETCSSILAVDNNAFEEAMSERPEAADLGMSGRMKFYEACKNNPEIPSVRFGISSHAPRVTRNQFSARGRRDRIEPHPTEDQLGTVGNWRSIILDFTVTSPTWDREDNQRKWKGRLDDGRYIYFDIADSSFWKKVLDKELETASPDLMKAQFLYQDVNGRYKSARAVKVISFNNQFISSPLSNDEVLARLEELNASPVHQNELFGINRNPT